MFKYSHFGSVYSRNPRNGVKETWGFLQSTTTDEIIDFQKLNNKFQTAISKHLNNLEKELKFVVEIMLWIDIHRSKYEIRLEKKAKISSGAYPKVLIDLADEKLLKESEIPKMIHLEIVKEWYASTVNSKGAKEICKGESISYGAASGFLVHSREMAENLLLENKPIIWCLDEVTTEDIKLFNKVKGLILTKSGNTSHAAVITKGLGIPALLGCKDLLKKSFENKLITIDANEGKVFEGELNVSSKSEDKYLSKLIEIAKRNSKIKVESNSDNDRDVIKAKGFGADSVGLCRTEHMFTDGERIPLIRKILFNDNPSQKTLDKLLEIQKKDFYNLFKELGDSSIIVRYLDAPLHEFIPRETKEIVEIAGSNVDPELFLKTYVEENPMLGFRGVRLLLTKPAIIKIQTRAVFQALEDLKSEGLKYPEVILEVPLVVDVNEVEMFKALVMSEIKEINPRFKYSFATMIETPRAALTIKDIAPLVDVLSFGTNDLTQMILGFSRDDTKNFMNYYIEKRLIPYNPFVTIDSQVVKLINQCVEEARKVNPKILIGVCGEHGGDAESIRLLANSGIDSVSCSPARVPTAIFATAKYS